MTSVRARTYTAGALTYTPASLVILFSWLIWGDFVLTMMEQVLPNLLPLLLKSNGANNSEIVIFVSTLAMVMNAALNPIISYNSDRFRSRWGRRRPFIAVTTPFVVLFLAAVPFAPEIFHRLNSHGFIARLFSMSPIPPLMLVFGALVIGFQTFNMFVASVYYYLIPDVVPPDLLGRFFALFRIFGAFASMTFNYLIFGLAQTHMRAIFTTTAVFYGCFILLMCWRVREGEYPPPLKEDHAHWWSGVRNYCGECFGHSYYWWVFLARSALIWAGIGDVFLTFYYGGDMGLSLDLIGHIAAASSLVFVVLAYPFGILTDRWGCQKAYILGSALVATSSVLFFLFANKQTLIELAVFRGVSIALAYLAAAKWTVEIYPRDRYGQFGSAGALFASVGGILLGPVCGWYMDWTHHYRYLFIWSALFSIVSVATGIVVYGKWKALGGTTTYHAP